MHHLRKTVSTALVGVTLALAWAPLARAYDTSRGTPYLKIDSQTIRVPGNDHLVSTRAEVFLPGLEFSTPSDAPYTVTWQIVARQGDDPSAPQVHCGTPGIFFSIAETEAGLGTCVETISQTVTQTVTSTAVFVGSKDALRIQVIPTVALNTGGLGGLQPAALTINFSDTEGPTVPSIEGMKPDPLVTTVGHLTIRARDLLGYALRMKQELSRSDASNPIYQMYAKSRQVANVLFIIALVIIAFLYNFAILISRDRLRRLLVLFTVAIIGVNFSYTVASLAVQGSERLFTILLVRDDQAARVAAGDPNGLRNGALSGAQISEEDLLTARNFTYSGFVGASKSDAVDTSRAGSERSATSNNRFRENIFFNLALIVAGAIAQFLIVLVLLIRIVILWALIIVAPFFFLLAIFRFSREIFKYWGWFFTRWILIGPLLALFLAVCVRIWSSERGIPISSAYERANINTFFPNITNIWIGAPGVRDVQGINLETPDQVMKYLMGLVMLYLAVFLPFYLTRRLSIHGGEGDTLLSKLLGSSKAKVKSDVRVPRATTEPPKTPPLKGGFTFKDARSATATTAVTTATATSATSIAAAGVAAAGAQSSASASSRAGAAAATSAGAASAAATGAASAGTARAGAGAGALRATVSGVARATIGGQSARSLAAAVASSGTTSAEAETIVRGAARRMQDARLDVTALAAQSKPKAVQRAMGEKVESVARAAGKADVKAAELHAMTREELSELRTHLAGLVGARTLGQDSALTRNLRAVDGEVRTRQERATTEREARVKINALAERAQKTALGPADLSVLRASELQALRSEIESLVAADASLKRNEALRATYEQLVARIQTQSVSSIASVTSAITAQTASLIQAFSTGAQIQRTSLAALSVPELKEVSLSIHRLSRAVRGGVDPVTIRSNLTVAQSALATAKGGGVDSTKVQSLLQEARSQRLAVERLATCTREELQQLSTALRSEAEAAGRGAAATSLTASITSVTSALAAAKGGGVDSTKVQSLLQQARAQHLTPDALATCTREELQQLSTALRSEASTVANAAASALVSENLGVAKAALATASTEGTLDSTRVDAVLTRAAERRLTSEDLTGLSKADLRAVVDELGAVDHLSGVLHAVAGVDPNRPEYKESLVVIRAEIQAREQQKAQGGDGSLSGGRSNPSHLQALLDKVGRNEVLRPEDLAVLSLSDLKALHREVTAIGDDRDGPTPPLEGGALSQTLANINHEKEQRAKLRTTVADGPPAILTAAMRKVRANVVLAASDLAIVGDRDLDWLRAKVSELLASVQAESSIDGAVDTIQTELRERRLKELQLTAEQESPRVAELLTSLVSGARISRTVLSGLGLSALRLLADLAERATTLVGSARASTRDYQASLRTIEAAFQKASLEAVVRQVVDASQAAQAVLTKVKAADALSAGELERLSLPELEAVQAETFRLNLIAPAAVKQAENYRDNLALVSQVYESRVVEGKATVAGSDGSARFIVDLQESVGSTLAQKIAELKAANKEDVASDLTAQQDDLGALIDRAAEIASQRAEWIEYFRSTPVPNVEGIANRRQWVEAEQRLTRAIYDEIASQDWVLQAKGIADAAGNLLMEDTSTLSPVQILTALAVKQAAADDALRLFPKESEEELILVPAAAGAAAAAAAKLRTFDEDDADERASATSRSLADGSAPPNR